MIGGFCMGDVHFMISEAAKKVNVETHVLRYWEEELELAIGRTEMGHRYYTEDNVQLFNCIKELKEQGMQLKDLKELVPDMIRTKEKLRAAKTAPNEEAEELSEIQKALLDNNKLLQDAITQSVVKEMGFYFQAAERQEEDRYQKLDKLIRQQQIHRKEIAKVPFKRNLTNLFTKTGYDF